MLLEDGLKEVSHRSSTNPFLGLASFLEIRFQINSVVGTLKKKAPPAKKEVPSKKLPQKETKRLPSCSLEKGLQQESDFLKELYRHLEQQNAANLDYNRLFSYLEHQAAPSPAYYQSQETEAPSKSSIMSDQKAKETIQKIQASHLTGGDANLGWQDKESFKIWQEFNKSILFLYDRLNIIQSSDVNYSQVKY